MTCPIHPYSHRVLYSAVNQTPSYSFIFLASNFHIRYVGKLVTSKDLYLQSIGKEVQVDWSHFIPQHSKEPGARTVRSKSRSYELMMANAISRHLIVGRKGIHLVLGSS